MKPAVIPDFISHYKIHSVLGKGSMGIVYLAEDKRLKRFVAIKCLYQLHSEELAVRLRREAKILAKLNHPNIVHIYDVIDEEQGFALIMEYVEGLSLDRYLKENSLDLDQKMALLLQILKGLAVAHRQGVIHRDLKLDNVLIDKQGRAKIGDFGLAKRQDGETVELTRHNSISGSIASMSPEQIRGERLSTASDIFSFGLLAWQLLRNRHPFAADSELLTVEKILNSKTPSLAGSDLPEIYTNCLDATLNKDPDRRPADIMSMIRILSLKPLKSSELEKTSKLRAAFADKFNFLINLFKNNARSVTVGSLVILLAFSLILALAPVLEPMFWPKPKPVYVAVNPPVLEANDDLDYSEVTQTVYDALQSGVIDLNGSFLIPPAEVEAFQGDPEKLMGALGADIVMSSRLECQELSCDFKLERNNSGGSAKLKSVHLVDRALLEIHRVTQLSLGELFPKQGGLLSLSKIISEQSYKRYIDLSRELRENESNHSQVLNDLNGLIEHAPNFDPLYALYVQIGLDQFIETRDEQYAEKVIAILEKAERSTVDKRKLQLLWVEAYAELGQLDHALKKIEQLEEAFGKSREVEVLKGLLEEKNEKFNKAIEHYQLANNMRPSVKTYRDIAINLWCLGDVKRAVEALKKSLMINPNDLHASLSLATFYLSSGNLDKAEALYLKNEGRSQINTTYSNTGLIYMLKRDYKKAEKYFLLAGEKTNGTGVWRLNLADTYLLQGEIAKAERQYLVIIEQLRGKDDSESLSNIAQAYIHMGKAKKALLALRGAKEISPNNSDVVYAEAIIFTKLRDYSSALAAIENSLEMGMGEIWYALSWFDPICNHPVVGPDFGELTSRACPFNP